VLTIQFKYQCKLNALWTVDYVRSLDPKIIPYNDDNEDQNVQPGDVLNHEYKDELSLDYSAYDGPSANNIPNCRDVDPPLNDMYAVHLFACPAYSYFRMPPSLGNWNGYFYDLEGVHWGAYSMMTFVLVPAEGERFKADVWSIRGRQTIFGSWWKGEDDVMQIKFKILPSGPWALIYFNGHFDPERDALTGVWGLSAELECSVGKMEFRRILPRHLIVYPSIKELSDDKPLALWRFAIAAVQNDIRRDRWRWSYFLQRRTDRKAVVPLLVRYRWFGPPLSAEETGTLYTIIRRMLPGDACFYDSKVDHIRAYTCLHGRVPNAASPVS
jgi:hypothetical protein